MGFFGKLKNKAMTALLKRQLKNLPAEQQEAMIKVIEENPEIFEKIATEVKEKKKAGQNEMYATMQVMQKYQSQLQQIFAQTQTQPKQKIVYKKR